MLFNLQVIDFQTVFTKIIILEIEFIATSSAISPTVHCVKQELSLITSCIQIITLLHDVLSLFISFKI